MWEYETRGRYSRGLPRILDNSRQMISLWPTMSTTFRPERPHLNPVPPYPGASKELALHARAVQFDSHNPLPEPEPEPLRR
jgi:hypothetical protein